MSRKTLGLLLALNISAFLLTTSIACAEEKPLGEGFEAEPEIYTYSPEDDSGHPDLSEKEILFTVDDVNVKWSDLNLSSGQSSLMASMSVNNDPAVSGLVNSDLTSFLKNLQGNYKTDLFSGAATFYYPLWVPSGRNEVTTPVVNLNYSSLNSDLTSLVGYGWNVNNSSIYRNVTKGVDKLYTRNDYSVDLFGRAEELISTDTANGKYAVQYESGFSNFVYASNTWIMTDNKGNKYYFGSQASSRQDNPADSNKVYRWMLDKIEDANGNFATFTYTKSDGQIYPDKIRYTAYGADAGMYEIRFNLDNRTYSLTNYRTGFKVQTKKYIKSVDVYAYTTATPELVRTYDFTQAQGNGALFQLKEIKVKNGAAEFPPIKFTYYGANETGLRSNYSLLKKIEFPAGGTQELQYKKSAAYRTSTQGVANLFMPFQIDTVYKSTVKESGSASPAVYEYAYQGGHYYFDYLAYYKREYAGFNVVTVKDPAANIKKTYFHQSEISKDNAISVNKGEYDDHISKKGKIFREEIYDGSNNLFKLVINKWDKSTLSDDDTERNRYFPFLKRSTEVDYDGNASAKTKATEYTYDSYGNVNQTVDYGEVTLTNDKGDFTDTGSDKVTTDYEYAANTTYNIVSYPKHQTAKDASNNVLNEKKFYYDGQSYGSIDKGNQTKIESLVSGSTYINEQTSYNSYGQPSSVTNARGYSTGYVYDSFNLFPYQITNANSQTTTYAYDYLYGQPKTVTDPNGLIDEYVYDGLGLLKERKVTNPDTSSQTKIADWTYDFASYPNSVVQNDYTANASISRLSKTYFDGLGRKLQQRTEAEGTDYTINSFEYDLNGRLKKEYLPKFASGTAYGNVSGSDPATTYTYDAEDRVATVATTLGTTSYAYDNWEKTITDANSKVKGFVYDARGNLIQVKEHLGANTYTTSYDYNLNNKLIKITDALGNIRNMTYDLLGRRLTLEDLHTSSDSTFGQWSFSYDDNGNVSSKTDPKSQVINYTYDQLDRLTEINYAGSAGVESTLTYDAGTNGVGHLTSVAHTIIGKTFTYDILGRLIQDKKTIASTDYVTNFDYDLLGNMLSVEYPDSMDVTYEYDNAAQLDKVYKDAAGLVTDIDYAPNGLISNLVYANGVSTVNTYDSSKLWRLTHKVTSNGTDALQDIAYTYDPVGNLTQIDDDSDQNASKLANYTYDDLYRLTQAVITATANSSDYTHTFQYDIIGNLLNKSDLGNYSYLGGSNATSSSTIANPYAATQINGVNYSYDDNGNLTSDSTWTHSWNYQDRISSSTDGTATVDYAYDENGLRFKKSNSGAGTESLYINDYVDYEDAVPSNYIMAGSMKVATVKAVPTPLPSDPGAELATAFDEITYHSADHLTGTNVDTNESGAMVETVDYFPFGEVRLDDNAPAYDNNYKYTGKELDAETGLSYYESRYYNAKTGKFVSLDSWEGDLNDPQSLNKYSYVKNNPLKYVDVTGQWGEEVGKFLYDVIQQTANDVVNVGGNTAQYVSEFGQASYYGASAIAAKATNDEAGYNSNIAAFQYHTNDKMVPAAQHSLNGVGTIAAIGVGVANMTGKSPIPTSAVNASASEGTTVYKSLNEAGQMQYVGITNDVERRSAEHLATKGITIQPVVTGLSRSDARAVEQYMIEQSGLMKNGGSLLNEINSIATKNPIYSESIKKGAEIFKALTPK